MVQQQFSRVGSGFFRKISLGNFGRIASEANHRAAHSAAHTSIFGLPATNRRFNRPFSQDSSPNNRHDGKAHILDTALHIPYRIASGLEIFQYRWTRPDNADHYRSDTQRPQSTTQSLPAPAAPTFASLSRTPEKPLRRSMVGSYSALSLTLRM